MAMESSVAERYTFMVRLKPALLLLRSLGAMQRFNLKAMMIVKKGNIQILARGVHKNAIASLNMEASTISSRSPDFAFEFDMRTWIPRLSESIIRQREEEPAVLIYKISTSPNLYGLVGDDSVPIHLGEVVFVTEAGLPIKELQTHDVVGYLDSKCFREVLSTFSAKNYYVGVLFTKDAITWKMLSRQLKYREETGDCYVENVEPGKAIYMVMKWLGVADVLIKASKVSDMVMISPLIDPEWKNWTLFSFVVGPKNYLCYLMRGPNVTLYFDERDKASSSQNMLL